MHPLAYPHPASPADLKAAPFKYTVVLILGQQQIRDAQVGWPCVALIAGFISIRLVAICDYSVSMTSWHSRHPRAFGKIFSHYSSRSYHNPCPNSFETSEQVHEDKYAAQHF